MSEQKIAWLESSRGYIKNDLECIASNFVKLGFHLWEVQQYEYYKEDNYESVHEFAEEEFGIKKSTCYNYIALMQKFSRDGHSCFLDDKFEKYNYSQLVEMLSIDSSLYKSIKPDYSIKQIREIKKYGKLVDETEMAKDMQLLCDWIKDNWKSSVVYSDFKFCYNSVLVYLKDLCSSYCGGARNGFIFNFFPSCIKINSYHFISVSHLLDCIEKYVGFDTDSEPGEELAEASGLVQTSGTDSDTATVIVPSAMTHIMTFEEEYNSVNDEPLETVLMGILKDNIKNVDKVKALIEFLNSLG